MKLGALHKVCAHPVVISWVLGACALDAAVVALLSKEGPLRDIISDVQATVWLALGLVPATALGYFLGMFTCWPWIRLICSRYNSAPLKVGDHVMILSGPQKGTVA